MILEVETKRSERGANRETGRSRLKRRAALALRSTRRDEVPGLKRGLIELADLILVNKADGDLADHARRRPRLRQRVALLRPALTE
jgi:LAO/AO transport system kinase